ncbi:MAG: hypothetical protein ACXVKH_13870 [Candidatus Angelobacter sp.]
MNRKLQILGMWPSRLLLVGMGFFGLTVFAQTPTDPPTPATEQQADKDKKPASTAKKEDERRQPDLGVAVDSGRKSDALATWITSENNLGETGGPWEIKQSIEFGGRITDFSGNTGTWDTFVNLGTGPRLLEYTLDMHSPDHKGFLFDDLTFSNFGYGGDPNNLSRVRAQKGKIYSFNGSFRRDQNIFDYNLFANPLNPPDSTPNVPILNSPHEFLMTRRMSDANLSLFPVGNIRFKLGWSRVVNEGSSFTSDHQGTDALLFQPTLNTTDNYNVGVSLRFIPRTNINYDQFYTYFKGDTSANLPTVAQMNIFGIPGFFLPGGIPVNLGLPFNTGANIPCAAPVVAGFANPTCSGYFSYNRFGRLRNSFPTEQFSFQSNYFHRVDLSGRLNYSDAEASDPSTAELFNGLGRNRLRAFGLTGSALSHRISLNGDLAATIHVTDKLDIVDTFRYDAFRIPGNWSLVTANLFGANLLSNPNTFSAATCPPPFTAATCPQHNASAAADIIVDNRNDFLGQKRTANTFLLEYAFTKRVSAHVGYRFERREITQRVDNTQIQTFFPGPTAALANRGACVGQPLNPDGTCTVAVEAADAGEDFIQINGHTGLIGFSARPTERLRLSADAEFFSGDNTFFRITPRHLQDYRFRANYKAKDWATFGAAVRILENRNTSLDIGSLQHNRSYGFTGVFAPPDAMWGLDLSYDYNDIFSQTNICFVATPNLNPPGVISCGAPFLSGLSLYTNVSHFGSGSLVLKPWKRVTAGVGYAVTSTNGNTLILNPIAPTGPLSLNYHLPTASLAIAVSEKVTFKSGWNYYGYNEKSDPGPTTPRDFRGNMFSLSLRYTM